MTRQIQANSLDQQPFRFACRVLLFFSPLLLIAFAAEWALWQTGETWPVRRVIAAQKEDPARLFLRGILDQSFYRYKLLQIQERKPRILVLGSSRVMEFRAEMFQGRAAEFFNAGGMIQDLSDLQEFVQRLAPEATPQVAILGLDLWWFNGDRSLVRGLSAAAEKEMACDWQEHARTLRRLKSAKGRKPLLAALRASNRNIGIEAREAGAGFRRDGSMHYAFPVPTNDWKFVDREKPPIPDRIRHRTAQFTPATGLSAERLDRLAQSLDELKKRNVLVLGFLPPFSSGASALLERSESHSNLWQQVRQSVPEVFRQRSMPFIDASVPTDLALDDRYLIDGIHAAETFHLYLFKRFLAFDAVRGLFPNLDLFLSAVLKSPGTDLWHCNFNSAQLTGAP